MSGSNRLNRFVCLCLIHAIWAVSMPATVRAEDKPFTVIPHFANGLGLKSEIILQNHSGIAQKGRVLLRKGQGETLEMNLNGTFGSEFPFTIEPQGVLKLESDGAGPLQAGYVRIENEGQASFLTGSLVFGFRGCEVSIVSSLSAGFGAFLERRLSSTPDSGGDTRAIVGAAFVNPNAFPLPLDLRLLGESGQQLGEHRLMLSPGEHQARFIDEPELFGDYFQTNPGDFRGSLQATSEAGEFAMTTLRQRLPSGRLSSLGSVPIGSMIERNAALQEDVEFLVSELRRLHPDPFIQVPEHEFLQSAARLQLDVPSLSDMQATLRMMQLVALIGDAHSKIEIPFPTPQLPVHILPFVLQWFEDGLFVIAAHPDHAGLLGNELVQIGGIGVEEVLQRLATLIPHENQNQVLSQSPVFFLVAEVLEFFDVLEDPSRGQYTFQSTAEGNLHVDIDSLKINSLAEFNALDVVFPFGPANPPPLYLTDTETNYRFRYLASSKALYLQYNRARNAPGQSFQQFVNQVFAIVDANPVERFVVDLRFNGGGDATVMRPLLDQLRQRPALTLPGRLFVLTGPETFSAAVINTIELKNQFGALQAGEPTGGKPNFFAEAQIFPLPNSNYTVRISTFFWQLIPGADPPTLLPDILVPLSSSDFFAGQDPVLDKALGY